MGQYHTSPSEHIISIGEWELQDDMNIYNNLISHNVTTVQCNEQWLLIQYNVVTYGSWYILLVKIMQTSDLVIKY